MEIEENKRRAGFWLGLVGALMLLLTGIVGIVDYGPLLNVVPIIVIPWILTFIWGSLALTGTFMIYIENDFGDLLLLAAGILSVFGMFFPIYTYVYEGTFYYITLSRSFGYFDPFLVLVGALIDILIKKEKI